MPPENHHPSAVPLPQAVTLGVEDLAPEESPPVAMVVNADTSSPPGEPVLKAIVAPEETVILHPVAAVRDPWVEYAIQWLRPRPKQNDAAQKVSAFTVALAVHAVIIFLLGLVILSVPLIDPPALTAVVAPVDPTIEVESVQLQKVQRVSHASSASATPTFTITSNALSNVTIPDFDRKASLDVTIGMQGFGADMGLGFEPDGVESKVNFFGIKSSGKRIAFVIDAEKFMLEDKKGGMPAYEKVKEEIGRMLAGLNRATAFNLLVYEGGRLATFRDKLIPAQPSAIREALAWLAPLNKDFDRLGIAASAEYNSMQVKATNLEPVQAKDISGYPKAIQAALEMDVHTLFIINSGWRHMHRTPTEKEKKELEKRREKEWDEKKQAEWALAVKEAHDFVDKENAARKAKGVPPKVIADWWPLVRQRSPKTAYPPSYRGYTPEEVEDTIKHSVSDLYRDANKPRPEVNVVLFIGEDEMVSPVIEEHFKNLTRGNRGKLKVLKGLAGIEDVTKVK